MIRTRRHGPKNPKASAKQKSVAQAKGRGEPDEFFLSGLTALKLSRWESSAGGARARLIRPVPAELEAFAGRECDWLKQVYPADRSAFGAWWKQQQNRRGPRELLDYRLGKKSGPRVWVRHWLGPVDLAPQVPRGRPAMSGFVQVIDAQKRAEAECLRVSQRERHALGQLLHDDVGQVLAGLACVAGALTQKSASPWSREFEPLLAGFKDQLRSSMNRMRASAHGLVPAPVFRGGLRRTLQALVEQTNLLYRVKVELRLPPLLLRHSEKHVTHLHGIAYESIVNAVRHGKATSIKITLRSHGKTHDFEIKDNGRGLPDSRVLEGGIGMYLMNHRAELLGGRLAVQNVRAGGVSVRLNFSLA